MEEAVGKITHYFGNLGVAAMELTGELKVGDRIHVKGHTTDFTQVLESMEVEHQRVQQAGPGQDVAFKTMEKARGGDRVYKITGP